MNKSTYLQENTARSDSECYIYELDAAQGSEPIISHWHDEVEIIYCGCGGQVYIEDAVVPFEKGDIVIVNKQKLHSCIVEDAGTLTCLLFDCRILQTAHSYEEIEGIDIITLGFPQIIKKEHCIYGRLCDVIEGIILAEKSTAKGKYLRINSLLYELFYIFSESDSFVANDYPFNQDNRIICTKEMITYMNKNISSHISLDELCDHVHLSKSYMIKMFKAVTGQTPSVYLRNLRLGYAYEYLKSGKSVTETALSCGFDNISYFIREYKKVYGVTPKRTK